MKRIILTRGLPASGKTTWAKDWVAGSPETRARVNRDDLREMLFAKPTYGYEQEEIVTQAQREAVRALLKADRDVVCDDTHLRPKYIREWVRFAKSNGAEIEVREFPIHLESAIANDTVRWLDGGRRAGEEVIRNLARKFMPKGEFIPVSLEDETATLPVETYVPDHSKPDAIIVDIDGTVALKAPGRDIYDLTRVHEDLPNRSIIDLVWQAELRGCRIIFCSGREETARAETEEWIDRNIFPVSYELHMRPAGDKRKDFIVKRELFDKHIRHCFNVRYVLDDRSSVVAMWRELGLTCLQVAPGDF